MSGRAGRVIYFTFVRRVLSTSVLIRSDAALTQKNITRTAVRCSTPNLDFMRSPSCADCSCVQLHVQLPAGGLLPAARHAVACARAVNFELRQQTAIVRRAQHGEVGERSTTRALR
jgi:hypothetical protein